MDGFGKTGRKTIMQFMLLGLVVVLLIGIGIGYFVKS